MIDFAEQHEMLVEYRNEWLQSLIDFAERQEMLVEFIICLPLLLMTLYILIVEQGSLVKYNN